jgi:UPF0271 protein
MTRIDLNADLGEAFGRWRLDDTAMLDAVTSASIACGFHAGDPRVMREMVEAAGARGVAIGAHPSYPDLVGFGRRELAASPAEIEADVVYQVGALAGVCAAAGARLRYVKPHGALYNRAARDRDAADAIARAVRGVDPSLTLLALAGSEMVRAAERVGIRVAREAFIDRGYRADGTLVPRGQPGAVLTDIPTTATRALRMVCDREVEAADGTVLALEADSLCAHGDGAESLALVRAVRARLEGAGIEIAPFAP